MAINSNYRYLGAGTKPHVGMIEDLRHIDKLFRAFFKEVLDDQIRKATSICGYGDNEFETAIAKMFDDPDSIADLSVEHRDALRVTYEAAQRAWKSAGGRVFAEDALEKHSH